jgi:hypothetical protein
MLEAPNRFYSLWVQFHVTLEHVGTCRTILASHMIAVVHIRWHRTSVVSSSTWQSNRLRLLLLQSRDRVCSAWGGVGIHNWDWLRLEVHLQDDRLFDWEFRWLSVFLLRVIFLFLRLLLSLFLGRYFKDCDKRMIFVFRFIFKPLILEKEK